jgi:O-antigen biosynthesis protein
MKNNKKISIIIPTYNKCDVLLKPCLESILKYTDMADVEIIISANGCTDNTREYVSSLEDVKLVWSNTPLGYPASINAGLHVAHGEFIVLLNNDTYFTDFWLDKLLEPFKDNTVGIVGSEGCHAQIWNSEGVILDRKFISFFCVAIRSEVFNKIGLLDEVFYPGCGEDVDFCIRAENIGYKLCKIPFLPITHIGYGTFGDEALMSHVNIGENKDKWWHLIKEKYTSKDDLGWGAGLSSTF